MDTYTVSFFGHRYIDTPLYIREELYKLIASLLRRKEYMEFLVGRDGAFDQLVSSAVRRCKREIRDENSAHIWIPPYMTAIFRGFESDYREYYDEIEICNTASRHYKTAFQARNRNMVDRSDLVVFFVKRHEGGAFQTMRYAMQQNKQCINLADSLEEYK